ncbi:hypothetical protein ACHQM5_023563 [Ranunculus cassubicifolius]
MAKTKCFSFTASCDWFYRHSFAHAGLKSVSTDLGDGTVMHCWVPKLHKPDKPTLLLIHGFGANAMWQWNELLRPFKNKFNLYVPDLLFFGGSYTTRTERSESFQAQCLMRLMEIMNVERLSLIGVSYGGFVGYSMANQFKDVVEKVVLCCAGVCVEEKDLKDGMLSVKNLDEATSILLPQTPEKLKCLVHMSFVKPAKVLPNYFLRDFIEVMCTEYVQEKEELIRAILKDRKISDIPKITQPTLLIWGEQDQIFPLELGYRLKRHIGENAEIAVIGKAGHALNLEKPKEFYKHLRHFLIESSPPTSPTLKENAAVDRGDITHSSC